MSFCKDCSKRLKSKTETKRRKDPYNDEIHGDSSLHYICDECFEECLGDI